MDFHLDRPGASTVELAWMGGLLRSPEVMQGRWKVTWSEDEFFAPVDGVQIVAGETRQATLVLEPTIPVAFCPTPAPVAGISFQVFDSEDRLVWERSYDSRASGTFQLGLRPAASASPPWPKGASASSLST